MRSSLPFRFKEKKDPHPRRAMVVSKPPAAGGFHFLISPFKECAWCGYNVEVKKARGIQGAARDPVDLMCPHALHATCLREWLRCVVTPGQRALLDKKGGVKYARSLRQLALAEYDRRFGGRCEACAARCSNLEEPSEINLR